MSSAHIVVQTDYVPARRLRRRVLRFTLSEHPATVDGMWGTSNHLHRTSVRRIGAPRDRTVSCVSVQGLRADGMPDSPAPRKPTTLTCLCPNTRSGGVGVTKDNPCPTPQGRVAPECDLSTLPHPHGSSPQQAPPRVLQRFVQRRCRGGLLSRGSNTGSSASTVVAAFTTSRSPAGG